MTFPLERKLVRHGHDRSSFLRQFDSVALVRLARLAIIEFVVVNLGHEAEPQRGVAVIEDQAMILALNGAQTATDDLHVQHLGFGWAGEDDAANIPVNTQREHTDVANDLIFTAGKLVSDVGALVGRREAIDVTSTHAMFGKPIGDMLSVCAIDREAEGWAPNAVLQPGLHDVGDQRLLVHRIAEVAFVIVTGDGAHAFRSGCAGANTLKLDRIPASISFSVLAAMISFS